MIYQYFSSLERLRLAQDGSSRCSRPHSHRIQSSLRNAPSCIDQQSPSLGRSFSRRLRKTQSTTASYLALQADTEWFWSLPFKIQQTQFSREEQVLFAGTRDSVILDAADESLLRLRQHLNACSDDARVPDTLCSRESLEVPPTTLESPPIDSAVDMDDGLFSGFRWEDDKDELDLSLDEYHAAIADTVRSGPSPGKCKPSFRRHLSVGSVQFHRNSSSFRKLSLSDQAEPSPKPSSPLHSRTGSTFLVPRHKSHASVSSIDPAAKHYRDPEARLKLRVYLASPQKFDEAIEFGFPSMERKEKPFPSRPATSPRLTEDSDRSFLNGDSDSLVEDRPCTKDDVSVTDSDSPRTPQESVFQPFSLPDGSSFENPSSTRPLVPRKAAEPYTHPCAAKREMTLHMTLTRPDLRTTDGPVIAVADEPLHITALPPLGEQHSFWDTLPADSSMVKRFWKRIRKS